MGGKDSRALRVGLLGGFGGGSVGNDASLDAMIKMVRRIDPDAHITCLCQRPEEIPGRFGIPALPIRAPRPVGGVFASPVGRLLRAPYRLVDLIRPIRVAGSFDVLFVPGTGVFESFGSGRATFWPLTLAVWFSAARMRGARTGLVSVGAGPMTHPVARRLASFVARRADYRTFRNDSSRDFMTTLGVAVAPDEVIPDLALSFAPHVRQQESERSLVAVPVMNYLGWNRNDPEIGKRHVATLGEFCAWLLKEGYTVRLIAADVHDHDATAKVAAAVAALVPDRARDWLTTAVATNYDELIELLAASSVVVASRYHSVVAALVGGKPTISLSYAVKNDDLMVAVGLGAYCQQVEHVDQELLRRQFNELVDSGPRVSAEVSARVAGLREKLAWQEKWLAESLRSSGARGRDAEGSRR